ncbi:phosphoribosylamine---glycine ligase [Thermoflexales bacterium]|nr:phosphoribosylamine---glycine ligase [Thermoflexales bacterium]
MMNKKLRVLIVGSGGREHAIAWKVAQSPRLAQLFVAPGNAGTESSQWSAVSGQSATVGNVSISAEDIAALVAFTNEQAIDLIIVGPEAPLAIGLADALRAAGRWVFGPSQVAAQIEASKAFSKDFMARHHIPTARFATFTEFREALKYLLSIDYPIVIKASGLAAGKGVILPNCADDAEAALRSIMLDKEFGAAGDEVIIEERLSGPEVSLLAFTDGVTLKPLPPAQDHKRIFDNDQGPNTGGMGAYAPAPICPPALVEEFTRSILQPTIDGLRAEGKPFVGVLYAGLMLTTDGPRVLEYNCRFGDPETQVILPLLETDLLDIVEACANGQLAEIEVKWRSGAAACVVMASEGYPGKYPSGREIRGLDATFDQAVVFQAGTQLSKDTVVTAGGRVLGITGFGADLREAIERAYTAVGQIEFEGRQYRKDIGYKAFSGLANGQAEKNERLQRIAARNEQTN